MQPRWDERLRRSRAGNLTAHGRRHPAEVRQETECCVAAAMGGVNVGGAKVGARRGRGWSFY